MGRDYFSICKPIAEGLTITTRAAKKSKNQNGSVKANGVQVETYWIAHCRELCGLAEPAGERLEWQQCPSEKLPAIKQAPSAISECSCQGSEVHRRRMAQKNIDPQDGGASAAKLLFSGISCVT